MSLLIPPGNTADKRPRIYTNEEQAKKNEEQAKMNKELGFTVLADNSESCHERAKIYMAKSQHPPASHYKNCTKEYLFGTTNLEVVVNKLNNLLCEINDSTSGSIYLMGYGVTVDMEIEFGKTPVIDQEVFDFFEICDKFRMALYMDNYEESDNLYANGPGNGSTTPDAPIVLTQLQGDDAGERSGFWSYTLEAKGVRENLNDPVTIHNIIFYEKLTKIIEKDRMDKLWKLLMQLYIATSRTRI